VPRHRWLSGERTRSAGAAGVRGRFVQPGLIWRRSPCATLQIRWSSLRAVNVAYLGFSSAVAPVSSSCASRSVARRPSAFVRNRCTHRSGFTSSSVPASMYKVGQRQPSPLAWDRPNRFRQGLHPTGVQHDRGDVLEVLNAMLAHCYRETPGRDTLEDAIPGRRALPILVDLVGSSLISELPHQLYEVTHRLLVLQRRPVACRPLLSKPEVGTVPPYNIAYRAVAHAKRPYCVDDAERHTCIFSHPRSVAC